MLDKMMGLLLLMHSRKYRNGSFVEEVSSIRFTGQEYSERRDANSGRFAHRFIAKMQSIRMPVNLLKVYSFQVAIS